MTGVESDLVKWAVQIGGPMAALLLLFGYFYRKDMKANTALYREDMKFYTDQMKQVSDEWKGHTGVLMEIVKENSAALAVNATSATQLTAVVQSLHAHITDGERRAFERNRDRNA